MSRAVEMAYEDAQKTKFTFLDNGTIEVQNASLLWRDFTGKPTRFNKNGKRPNFNLVLSDEVLAVLKDLEDRRGAKFTIHHVNLYTDEFCAQKGCENVDVPYINIKINMEGAYPPIVKLYTEYNGQRSVLPLDKDTISLLDSIDIVQADLVFRAYVNENYPDQCSAYLQKLYVVQNPQVEFGGKYDDFCRNDSQGYPADEVNPATGD